MRVPYKSAVSGLRAAVKQRQRVRELVRRRNALKSDKASHVPSMRSKLELAQCEAQLNAASAQFASLYSGILQTFGRDNQQVVK